MESLGVALALILGGSCLPSQGSERDLHEMTRPRRNGETAAFHDHGKTG